MNWLILLNFIASIFSVAIIWRGFCETNSSDLILGVILLFVNLSCLIFNLTRKFYE
jgi:ABC-type bacteriocin/lantibiotic exporter with double-glycine peptidase domain